MEYAQFIDLNPEEKINLNYQRYVGYQDTNSVLNNLFSINTLNTISKKLTQLLMGVHPDNKIIVVPTNLIANVLDSVYQGYRPQTGGIYSRYIIPTGLNSSDYATDMVDQTIEIIYSDIKNQYDMEKNNKTLSVWNTILGDFNENQLRSHPPIKILNKHPQYMAFFENY